MKMNRYLPLSMNSMQISWYGGDFHITEVPKSCLEMVKQSKSSKQCSLAKNSTVNYYLPNQIFLFEALTDRIISTPKMP